MRFSINYGGSGLLLKKYLFLDEKIEYQMFSGYKVDMKIILKRSADDLVRKIMVYGSALFFLRGCIYNDILIVGEKTFSSFSY